MACKDCKWWVFDKDLTMSLEFIKKGNFGQCHYNAPKADKGFADTDENEFCGKQEKK